MQRKDSYCWVCHRECHQLLRYCQTCPRVYHRNCTPTATNGQKYCPQCEHIRCLRGAEDIENREERVEELADLLKFAVELIAKADKYHMFSSAMFDEDLKIVNDMHLSIISKRVRNREYVSTASFMADVKWIHHNCVIRYNSGHEYAKSALKLLEVARLECEEIETCGDCYRNYHDYKGKDVQYFAKTCHRPHAIVWAKLKGYPYWPAKVVNIDESKGRVDVRFFGDHNKCWLSYKHCYLMSKSTPSPVRNQKHREAINEMYAHLDQLNADYPNAFRYYPHETVFKPENLYLKIETSRAKDSDKFENGFRLRDIQLNLPKIGASDQKVWQFLNDNDFTDSETEIDMETSSLSSEINSEDSSDVQITQNRETKENDSHDSVLSECNNSADVSIFEGIIKLKREKDEYFKQWAEIKAENERIIMLLKEMTAERDKYRDLVIKTDIKVDEINVHELCSNCANKVLSGRKNIGRNKGTIEEIPRKKRKNSFKPYKLKRY